MSLKKDAEVFLESCARLEKEMREFFKKLRESVESDTDVLYRSYVTLWKEAREFFKKMRAS